MKLKLSNSFSTSRRISPSWTPRPPKILMWQDALEDLIVRSEYLFVCGRNLPAKSAESMQYLNISPFILGNFDSRKADTLEAKSMLAKLWPRRTTLYFFSFFSGVYSKWKQGNYFQMDLWPQFGYFFFNFLEACFSGCKCGRTSSLSCSNSKL